jgi:hypothetical protein
LLSWLFSQFLDEYDDGVLHGFYRKQPKTVSAQVVCDFLLQHNNKLCSFVSAELMDFFVDWQGPVTDR